MNAKQISAVVGLFLGFIGPTYAATTIAQGVINFHGSIVEAPCSSDTHAAQPGSGANFSLNGCPQTARGGSVNINRVQPITTVAALSPSAVKVKLVADSGRSGPYYNQQYALVDGAGKAINSGAYIITLTSP